MKGVKDMAIPQYFEFYQDFLDVLADGNTHSLSDARRAITEKRQLSSEDLSQLLPSGTQYTFNNRVNWAAVYLYQAGLVERPFRGKYRITEEGKRVYSDPSIHIDNDFLMQYPSFQNFIHGSSTVNKTNASKNIAETLPNETPSDTIDIAVQRINQSLADELMQEIMRQDSDFFERLVVRLLLKMGYGGTFEDSGIVTQSTGDGGIDGIIKEDKLGFSQIYIQAKRWKPDVAVSRPEIDKFSGALHYRGVSKGLFITTAKFSKGAMEAAERQHMILIDGDTLTRLMIEYNVGVSVAQTYFIKKVDTDFFDENHTF